jgi:DNA-binding transcriptional ArsR family regulator
MNQQMIEELAVFFRALADPTRISLVLLLREGERSVTDLASSTGTSVANVSKHLALLHRSGLLGRRKEGNQVLYSLGNENILEICDCICGDIRGRFERKSFSIADAAAGRIGRSGEPVVPADES